MSGEEAPMRTHVHRFAKIFLVGLYIDFHSFVQPNPNLTHLGLMPNPNLNLTWLHTALQNLTMTSETRHAALGQAFGPHEDCWSVFMQERSQKVNNKNKKSTTKTKTHTRSTQKIGEVRTASARSAFAQLRVSTI